MPPLAAVARGGTGLRMSQSIGPTGGCRLSGKADATRQRRGPPGSDIRDDPLRETSVRRLGGVALGAMDFHEPIGHGASVETAGIRDL